MVVRAAIVLCALAAAACRNSEKEKPRGPDSSVASADFSFSKNIGWWHGRCLAIANESLTSGSPVTLVVTGEPQTVRLAKTGERVNTSEGCAPLLEGRATINKKAGMAFYALNADSVETTDMGVGIVAAPNAPTVVNGIAEASLQPGQKNFFTSCETSEGIRFEIWKDKAFTGEPLWSGYYFLDYDTTPTCK